MLSNAAKQMLRERVYRSWGLEDSPNYWFGYGNNAQIRELESAGMIDSVRIGWSAVRVVTRAGWELAERLQQKRERLLSGVPITEYKLERGLALDKPGLVAGELDTGGWVHSDGCMIARGKSRSTEVEGAPRLTPEWLRARAAECLSGCGQPCRPIGFQLCGGGMGGGVIWFDCGEAILSRYYAHVVRLAARGVQGCKGAAPAKLEWSHVPGGGFFAYLNGRVVALVMPTRSKMPDGVRALILTSATMKPNYVNVVKGGTAITEALPVTAAQAGNNR